MSIEVRNVTKRYGDLAVCDNLSLDVPAGELVALLGPSGSGKTTLLRIIAGLEVPDAGSVLFHGEDATNTEVRERNVGFVFQHYALFGHMTIAENVAFGLRVRPKATRPSDREIKAKVADLLKLVQLDWLADRHPHQLSGGQRQRVALARALAVEPKVLLLDEPFGALDAKVRKELRRWLRRLHDEMHVTSVFVTHDQEEAMEVADRVVVMNARQDRAAGRAARGLRPPGHAVRAAVPRRREPVHARLRDRLRAPARDRHRRRARARHLVGDGGPDAHRGPEHAHRVQARRRRQLRRRGADAPGVRRHARPPGPDARRARVPQAAPRDALRGGL